MFKRLTCTFVWRYYSVVVEHFTPSSSQITCTNLNVYYGPLSVETLDGIPQSVTHLLLNIVSTVVIVVFVGGVAVVSLENVSFITTMNCFPVFLFGRGLKILIETSSIDPVGVSWRSLCGFSVVRRIHAHFL